MRERVERVGTPARVERVARVVCVAASAKYRCPLEAGRSPLYCPLGVTEVAPGCPLASDFAEGESTPPPGLPD